jgi:site-specific recombinase XerD
LTNPLFRDILDYEKDSSQNIIEKGEKPMDQQVILKVETILEPVIEPVSPLPADRNPALVYLAGLDSGTSRRSMEQALNTIAGILTNTTRTRKGRTAEEFYFDCRLLPWWVLRFQHTAAIRARLSEMFKPATTNRLLAALRGVLKASWRLGLMTAEEYQRASDVGNVRGETLPAGALPTWGELSDMMDMCLKDNSLKGYRDAAVIGVLASCGLRRAELTNLDLTDYDAEAHELRIQGKGHKERLVPLCNGGLEALEDWIRARGNKPGPLFWACGGRGGHLIRDRRLTEQAVYNIVQERAQQAGARKLTPHDLRRWFVSRLLEAGGDISIVQKLVGHSSINTTTRYDLRGESEKLRTVSLLHIPYRRR